jgi:uncharacterized protein YutE (UPF0331/DUF86 family)
VNDDVTINKIATIERCLRRVREEVSGDIARLQNQTVQDSVVLNLQRACESAIDLAMHMVAVRRIGVPQDSRDAFALLRSAGVIDSRVESRMKAMVGFRNIAIHEYQRLDIRKVEGIIDHHLGDFDQFCKAILGAV